MVINRNIEIGLSALLALQTIGGIIWSNQALADYANTTPAFMAHIMLKLKKAGLVGVKRGPSGGYVFKKYCNAYDVATALGVKFNSSSQLSRNVINAFKNTEV